MTTNEKHLFVKRPKCLHNQSNTNSPQWLHSPCSPMVCPDCWDYAVYPGYVHWMLSTYVIHGAGSFRNTLNTVRFCCSMVSFLQNAYDRHPKYSAFSTYRSHIYVKISWKTPHGLPMKARYGVSFVYAKSDWSCIIVTVVLCVFLC